MRIVAGTFRGRVLAGPKSGATRPTSDRVREAIFNVLSHGVDDFQIENQRVLDLFAGTGALGFEALSRGAKFCQFVDDNTGARSVIRENADSLGVTGLCKIWRRDATSLGPCAPQTPFGLVFCDPPYGRGMGQKALASLVEGGWLSNGSVVILEEGEPMHSEPPLGLLRFDFRTYGDTRVEFYRYSD